MKGVSPLPPLNFCRQDSIMAGKHAMKEVGAPAFDSPWYLPNVTAARFGGR
jgi:hypothetical protein